jgi:3'-phosphoadenosine 5'-phosphosulfate sulfotransferase (PAPS reductase)/FAD synthetase
MMNTLALPMVQCRSVSMAPDVQALLADGAPVAIGVSGGKDSCAVALAVTAHLDSIGHAGPRLLIHADLGATEWEDSLPTCERLANRLGLELVVVRRPQGDMMERWEQRWQDNVRRWTELSCVKLILPWSTPAMRFCTAELKVDQICRALSRRFEGRAILNVTGIRRDESNERSKAPISQVQPKLASKSRRTSGLAWNAIANWGLADVFAYLEEQRFPLHEAYTVYGSSRVSCVWCVLGTEADHRAAAKAEANKAVGRRMVDLEISSTFAFQGNRWLGDTLAGILAEEQRTSLPHAKLRAQRRQEAEARIPKHLLYTKGWPTSMPTREEAQLLADVRAAVAEAVGIAGTFVDPERIISRYRELLDLKDARASRSAKRHSA